MSQGSYRFALPNDESDLLAQMHTSIQAGHTASSAKTNSYMTCMGWHDIWDV
jgi:hypothetical protein